MSESPRCPKCGIQLPADAPAGLCPKCLVQAGFESQPAADSAEPGPTKLTPPASGFVPPTVEELAPLFPQLEILELLGKGGMGAVYKARQPGLDRLVAVKILPPEISHDSAFTERFQREARALARLSHPHIVAVYDFGQTLECGGSTPPSIQLETTSGAAGDDPKYHANAHLMEGGVKPPHSRALCYIVMEFVDGANLRQAMRTGTITSAEALAIVPQICEALQFAHDEGIVHRDIKPENILIDKRGRVKIADFGLAKLLGQDASDHSLTATHQVMGTLRYMAPEQMQGSREVDHRADIYSLGVVFYELLTGELPMGRFAPPSKWVQVDVRLDEVVLRALEQDPEQRYQHASDVKSEIDSIRTTPAPPKPVEQRDPREPFREVTRFAMTPNPSYARRVGIPMALLFGLGAMAMSYATAVYGQKDNYQEGPSLFILISWATLFWVTTIILHILFFARRRASTESAATPSDDSGRATRPSYGKRVGIPMTILFGLFAMATNTAQLVYGLEGNNYPGHPKILIIGNGVILFWLGVIILHVAFFARRALPAGFWATVTLILEEVRRSIAVAAETRMRVAQENAMQSASSLDRGPRFSRFAIAGAVWAIFGLLTVIPVLYFIGLNRVWNGTALPTDIIYEAPPLAFTIFMGALLAIGSGAPIGTTIYGGIAIGHIKRSGGKIIGLPLAVADVLFFPLLVLSGLIAALVARVGYSMAPHPNAAAVTSAGAFGVLVALVVCFFVARAVWRAITKQDKPFDQSPPISSETMPRRRNLLIATATLLAIGIPVAVWLEPLAWTHKGATSFQLGKSQAYVHQFGDHVGLAVWIEEGEREGAGYSEHLPGYDGAFRLSENRRFSYRSVTNDGQHGTVSFNLNGDGSLSETYQLAAGRLFLVSTQRDKLTIRQLNPDLSGISPKKDGLAEGAAKVKALAESDAAVRAFLAGE